MANAVTHRVPIMNGYKPNFPSKGCHEGESSNSLRGLVAKIGIDLWNKTNAMMKTIRLEKTVANNMNLLARRSFNLLFISFLSQDKK